ncbi:S41 family peptidase [Marinicrinis sediminis]|uniref:S41 family peptidase n=1 Tax=Marinicrinis sediminis TaxID=1652465 RepID=A0ABW5RB00_9BACL
MIKNRRTVAVMVIISMLAGSMLTLLIPNVMDAWESSVFHDSQQGVPEMEEAQPPFWKQNGMTEQQMQKIATTYRLIQNKYVEKMDGNEVIDGAITGMLDSLKDPYSVYMDTEQAEQFNETVFESQFSGIGAEVTMDEGKVTIMAPIKGSPAERAGLLPKDVILSVNGEKLLGLTLNEAVAKIRGPKGTQAKLEIVRGTQSEPMEIIVVRDDIDINTVFTEMLDNGIGYMDIRQFALNTGTSFEEQLAELEKQNMKGLIIDLRNNPGGVLSVVISMVQKFVPAGEIVVQVEDASGQRQQEKSKDGSKTYPVVVIINEGSASASEIMAAALQESAGMQVVGMPSFGKGTVQSTFDSGGEDGSSLKMTIAKWLTPNGNDINKKGVQPDVKVELPDYFQATILPKDEELQYDDNNGQVRSLQLMLTALGYKTDRTDGYFSEQTKLAVRAFQKIEQLPMDGIVNEKTATRIEEKYIEKLRLPESDLHLQKAIEVMNNRLNP